MAVEFVCKKNQSICFETSLKSDGFSLNIMPKADPPSAEAVEPRKL
jgi:hypothetical protein